MNPLLMDLFSVRKQQYWTVIASMLVTQRFQDRLSMKDGFGTSKYNLSRLEIFKKMFDRKDWKRNKSIFKEYVK